MNAEQLERVARVKEQAMRNHPFEGASKYCEHWSGSRRETSVGTLTFGTQCGYPSDLHRT